MLSEMLPIRGRRHLANATELPVEVSEIRQTYLIRNRAYGKVRLREPHAGAPNSKFTKVGAYAFARVLHEETMERS